MVFSSSYALGLVFIALVAVIWAAASVLVQYLYEDYSFHSPFLLTYIGVSLFSLWIPSQRITQWVRGMRDSKGLSSSPPSSTHSYEQVPMTSTSENEHNSEPHPHDDSQHQSPSTVEPSESQHQHDHNNTASTSSIDTRNNNAPHNLAWSNEQHFRVACQIAPVWFLANWTYNASLAYTSITSSTVLASTGSLFTFLFAVLAKDEHFCILKLVGVLLGFCGSVVTTFGDSSSQDIPTTSRPVLGDILGLASAVGYGAYAVQARLLCPHDESLYSMQLLLGYIGLINMTLLSPIALFELWGHGTGLTWKVFGFLVVKGLFDNVLSDYLWLRAVILINATVATVGLGLTIPLAFVSDLLLGKPNVVNAGSIFGALTVLAGFVLVNVGNEEDDDGQHKESTAHTSIAMQSIIPPADDKRESEARHGTSLSDSDGKESSVPLDRHPTAS